MKSKIANAIIRARENLNSYSGLPSTLAIGGSLSIFMDSVKILVDEIERLDTEINTPEVIDFAKAVQSEAAHQRERWGAEHDAGKSHEDWFWVLAYLSTKALQSAKAGDFEKAQHHKITAAALLANWHSAATGSAGMAMRPGVSESDVLKLLGEPPKKAEA